MKVVGCAAFFAGLLALLHGPGGTAPAAAGRGDEPASANEPVLQAADDGATIAGRVRIKGEIPKRRKIPTNADPKCAALHAGDLLSDDFVIDPAGNVEWALVYVKEGLEEHRFTPPKTPVVVEQKGCHFEPHVMGIMTGQELMFRNQDPLMHIVHVIPKNNREFGFSQAKTGEERAKIFNAKEIIRLFCDVHPWMVAWIVVLDHPLYSATGPDGRYKIKGLPPGKYTLEVWHESYKPVTQQIEVKPKDSKTFNFELTEKLDR
jgi:plastocyanin